MKPLPPMEPIPPGIVLRLRNSFILQAWLVLTLALCFGAALAAVHLTFGPKIEENKINETRQRVPEIILGSEQARIMLEGGEDLVTKPHSIAVKKGSRDVFYQVYEVQYSDGRPAGWVAKASGQGYADRIELLVGFDPGMKTITGVFILDQKETPGLGNQIVSLDWRGQFAGLKTTQPIEVTKSGAKGPNEVDAITGATISSRSVSRIINGVVNDLQEPLAAMTLQKKD